MKWFKHDSTAHIDAKLVKIKHKYGITGYGLYWYCLELIAGSVSSKDITFQLEYDAETIATEWGLDQIKVQEIMREMVTLGLFEYSNDKITCLTMATRLDDTNSKNPQIKQLVSKLNPVISDKLGETPNNSGQTRSDQTRSDQTKQIKTLIPKNFKISDEVKAWAEKNNHQNLEQHHESFLLTCEAKGYKYTNWDSAFKRAIRDNWAKISTAAAPVKEWHETQSGILEKAEELEMVQEEGEPIGLLKQRIARKLGVEV